ncbi:unnamed protein product [Arctia plantaginis]|uniref:EGF-like domain-containing protein n=1 Tax=Arctia plantaginis TaxID=874455 RepID=A0A8S1A403_ARCPL|nr:unnamed protein product [Arctia plantaginis]
MCVGRTSVSMLLLSIVFITFYNSYTNTQICTKSKVTSEDRLEIYTASKREHYRKPRCWFRCKRTRWVYRNITRTKTITVNTPYNDCCPGYVKDENYRTLQCKPVCSKACEHGFCQSPEKCACNENYAPDLNNKYKCTPICVKSCGHGNCIAPDTCKCNRGYSFMNNTCTPVCIKPCTNGICVAPDTCECLSGYKKPSKDKTASQLANVCEPHCSSGTCIAPDTCECLSGYKNSSKDKRASYVCEPHCSSGCLHGSCVSPEICVCDLGYYEYKNNFTCVANDSSSINMARLDGWTRYNWIYAVAALLGAVVITISLYLYVTCRKRNLTQRNVDEAELEVRQAVLKKFFRKATTSL